MSLTDCSSSRNLADGLLLRLFNFSVNRRRMLVPITRHYACHTCKIKLVVSLKSPVRFLAIPQRVVFVVFLVLIVLDVFFAQF